MRLRSFLGLRSLPGSTREPIYSRPVPKSAPLELFPKKRGSQNGPLFVQMSQKKLSRSSLFRVLFSIVRSKNSSFPCAKATWTAFEKGSVSPPLSVFRLADNSHFFRLLQFSGPHFYQFLAEPGPSPGPFLEKVDFEGDPKIVILGTESTFLSAENSINPYIKATSGPTSSILGGSGK